MRSCDALVTKAGYGGVTESAVNSTYHTERTNWCETSILETWIAKNCTGRHIERDVMQSGDFGAVLQDLLAVPITKQSVRSGVDDAVAVHAVSCSLGKPQLLAMEDQLPPFDKHLFAFDKFVRKCHGNTKK